MATIYKNSVVQRIIQRARTQAGRDVPFAEKLTDIQHELRLRRRQLIGSYVSVRELVLIDTGIDEEVVESLSQYLASCTVQFWSYRNGDAENFCYRFYRLAVCALSGGKVRGECFDDILQLADCLVRSRKVFFIAMKDMLPENMIGALYEFVETEDKKHFEPTLLDAVMGGICVFLGALPSPESLIVEAEED